MNTFFVLTFSGVLLLSLCTAAVPEDLRNKSCPIDSSGSGVIYKGEYLRYNVSYLMWNIGEVRLYLTDTLSKRGEKLYKAEANIFAYDDVPLLDLHLLFYTTALRNSHYSIYFKGLDDKTEYMTSTEYFFDYDNDSLRIISGRVHPQETWKDSTSTLNKRYFDGLSLLYYARNAAGSGNREFLPCFVNDEEVITELNFPDSIVTIKSEYAGSPVECYLIKGNAPFENIAGMKGDFIAYVTADEARIPILAEFTIVIGEVKLELIEWDRGIWKP